MSGCPQEPEKNPLLKKAIEESAKKYKKKHLESGEEAEKILGACKDE